MAGYRDVVSAGQNQLTLRKATRKLMPYNTNADSIGARMVLYSIFHNDKRLAYDANASRGADTIVGLPAGGATSTLVPECRHRSLDPKSEDTFDAKAAGHSKVNDQQRRSAGQR